MQPTANRWALTGTAAAAAVLPSLLAYNPAPSSTFLNQALALAGWAVFVLVAGGAVRAARPAAALLAALALVAAAALASGLGPLPASLALSALGMLAAAAVMAAGGAAAQAAPARDEVFAAFCWGWLVAGLANAAIAALQVFAPDVGGDWIARSGLPGRAVGNLRQPNHLSSLLVWSAIAAVALLQMGRLRPARAAAAFALAVAAVVLTGSRTGLVSVGLLAAWGAFDRRLQRPARWTLLAAPLVFGAVTAGMAWWAQAGEHVFGLQQQLAKADPSASRFGIWANTLVLIRENPWLGVGFGEFNLAWSLHAFPGRPVAFFDHAHNLPLHLAAELGLPLAAAVLGLLALALWQAWRRPGVPARCATVFVAMIGLHSLLEYPLWYAYFLLPAAWAWGFALGRPQDTAAARSPALPAAAALVVLGAVAAVVDYGRVTRIFEAGARATPLAQRIAEGRRSWFFAHHADYAAATTGLPQPDGLGAFDGAKHFLLDTRLMVAWADALAAAGRVDEARWVAARLREFGAARAEDFFGECENPASAAGAYQCEPPAAALPWRRFLQPSAGATQ